MRRLSGVRGGASVGERQRPHILFTVNVDWFFLSHRLPIARAARDHGAHVTVVAAETGKVDHFRREGLEFIPMPMTRKGTSPLEELRTFAFLVQLYRRLKPDLVHQVTIKPVLYGSFAAKLAGDIAVVNAITGLGYTFTGNQRAGALRSLLLPLLRTGLRSGRSRTIFQNPDDRDRFIHAGLLRPEQAALIRGSGVDAASFQVVPEPEGEPLVILPARMLWDKGVGTFVEAAHIVRSTHPQVRFVLAGAPDEGNPTAVPVAELEAWAREGVVEWWGHREDMPAVLSQATIVALPTTYPEGVPKVLLEAAASGRPVVATDGPGCREIVRPGVNGLLIPPNDPEALARAVISLVEAPELRTRYGRAGREIAVSEFEERLVVRQTMQLYRELLGDWPVLEGSHGR